MKGEGRPFPWEEVLAFGFLVLKLSSKDLWAMTPRELSVVMKARRPVADPLTRSALDGLMQRFPDT